MTPTKEYEGFVSDLLDTIQDMRESGIYDEETLEGLEWRILPPKQEEGNKN